MNDIKLARLYLDKYNSAKQRGIKFSLTFISYKNMMRAKRCFYSGIELTEPYAKSKNMIMTDRTIDRIDSSKGYVKGNVAAVCHAANQFKSHWENSNNIVSFEMVKRIVRTCDKVIGR